MHKIIIVDDSELDLKLFSDLLRMEGYDVETYGSPTFALKQMDFSARLLISDVTLKPISGLELLRIVRTRNVDMPAIAVSALCYERELNFYKASGFDFAFGRPISSKPFLKVVKCLLERGRLK